MTNYRYKELVNFARAVVDYYSSRWFVQAQWWMDWSNQNSVLERNWRYSFVDLPKLRRYCSTAMVNRVVLAMIDFHCNDWDVSVADYCTVAVDYSSVAVPTIWMNRTEMDPTVDWVSNCSSNNYSAHHPDDYFLHLVDLANCLA